MWTYEELHRRSTVAVPFRGRIQVLIKHDIRNVVVTFAAIIYAQKLSPAISYLFLISGTQAVAINHNPVSIAAVGTSIGLVGVLCAAGKRRDRDHIAVFC